MGKNTMFVLQKPNERVGELTFVVGFVVLSRASSRTAVFQTSIVSFLMSREMSVSSSPMPISRKPARKS
jgi:hypothetical protein